MQPCFTDEEIVHAINKEDLAVEVKILNAAIRTQHHSYMEQDATISHILLFRRWRDKAMLEAMSN